MKKISKYLIMFLIIFGLSGCSWLRDAILDYQSMNFPVPATNGIVKSKKTGEPIKDVIVTTPYKILVKTDFEGKFLIPEETENTIPSHPMSANNVYITYSFAIGKTGYMPRVCVCYNSIIRGCRNVEIDLKTDPKNRVLVKDHLLYMLEVSNATDRENTQFKMVDLDDGIYCSDGLK